MNNSITLSELTERIQETISLNFSKPIWIRAEISELRENSGHCYMELIEKSEGSDSLLAKSRATCWASTYRMLKPYFESSTGQSLTVGLKVLVAVTVEFHGVYGFNLNLRDIDPAFTVGEMAMRRLEIIRQLEADGVVDMNKQLTLPYPAQRIAIISSPTAAGYDDFSNQLKNDPNRFAFYTKLFPAVMQGEGTESSVILALDKIFENAHLFDVVVIIRGGGATTDLAAFDSYALALNCAQFPLPIISGIGHQRDVSILDMVAHTSVKTPTAAAEFLISNMMETESEMLNIVNEIQEIVRDRIDTEYRTIDQVQLRLKHALKSMTAKKSFNIESQKQRLQSSLRMLMMKQNNCLQILEKNIETYSPDFLLKHGYSITTLNGKRIVSVVDVNENDNLRTHFKNGYIDSKVTSASPKTIGEKQ